MYYVRINESLQAFLTIIKNLPNHPYHRITKQENFIKNNHETNHFPKNLSEIFVVYYYYYYYSEVAFSRVQSHLCQEMLGVLKSKMLAVFWKAKWSVGMHFIFPKHFPHKLIHLLFFFLFTLMIPGGYHGENNQRGGSL